jgi:hypothetical protein
MELSKRSSVTDSLLTEDKSHHDVNSHKPNDSVYRRITTIIGGHPNRSELTAIVNILGWIPLGRSEKRVKALLIQKLEGAREKILPVLETTQGMRDLETAYLTVIERKRREVRGMEGNWMKQRLLPDATVEYHLNRPRIESGWNRNGEMK